MRQLTLVSLVLALVAPAGASAASWTDVVKPKASWTDGKTKPVVSWTDGKRKPTVSWTDGSRLRSRA